MSDDHRDEDAPAPKPAKPKAAAAKRKPPAKRKPTAATKKPASSKRAAPQPRDAARRTARPASPAQEESPSEPPKRRLFEPPPGHRSASPPAAAPPVTRQVPAEAPERRVFERSQSYAPPPTRPAPEEPAPAREPRTAVFDEPTPPAPREIEAPARPGPATPPRPTPDEPPAAEPVLRRDRIESLLTDAPAGPRPRRSGPAGLWVAIAVVLVGGGAAAAYLLSRPDTQPDRVSTRATSALDAYAAGKTGVEVSRPEEGFTATFPAAPTREVKHTEPSNSTLVAYSSTLTQARRADAFLVDWATWPSSVKADPTLRVAVDGIARQTGGTVLLAQPITLESGGEARDGLDYVVQLKGAYAHGRYVIGNGRVYQIQLVTVDRDSDAYRRFLDSFELISP